MLRRTLVVGAALTLFGCSGNTAGGPGVVKADRSGLLFGLDTGDATLLGTQPINTLQLTNTGGSDVTISGTAVVAGQPFTTQPIGTTPGRSADLSHPDFFVASQASQATIKPNETAVVQVIFKPGATGLFAASLKVSTSVGDVTAVLAGDCVTPLLQVGQNSQQSVLELPPVALKRKSVDLADGGPAYVTGDAVGVVALYDVGTADLNFTQMDLTADAGRDSPISLCQVLPVPDSNCTPLPVPPHLPRAYPDGGISVRHLGDGGSEPAAGLAYVFFNPAQPGEYTQTLTLSSDATNLPTVTIQIHGTATPDGG